jgi:hypothetical protein
MSPGIRLSSLKWGGIAERFVELAGIADDSAVCLILQRILL